MAPLSRKFTYPRARRVRDNGRSTHILDHNCFLFQEKPKHFSYQHNSRGIQDFFAGYYDLRKVSRPNKVLGLLMMQAAIKGCEAVAWIEHTSNWDGFVCFETKDKLRWTTTWEDFRCIKDNEPIDPMEPRELYLLDSDDYFDKVSLRLYGGYLPDDPATNPAEDMPEFAKWDDGKEVDLNLDDLCFLNVWFDT